MTGFSQDVSSAICDAVGSKNYVAQGPTLEDACTDFFKAATGEADAIAFPTTTQAVSDCVVICAHNKLAITPQGGKTGLVAGSIPGPADPALIVNLSKLKQIEGIDLVNRSVVVGAGVTVAELQAALEPHDLMLPMSIGSDGDCQVGGIIGTNAGGHGVLRYGMTRQMVLGVEAVLPDGEVISNLRALRKDNVGYDIAQLFCGAEGTLGIVTKAALSIVPRPKQQVAAFLSLPSIEAVIKVYSEISIQFYEFLSAFELLPANGLEIVAKHLPDGAAPDLEASDWYILLEVSSSMSSIPLEDLVSAALAPHFETGLIADGLIAQSEAQRMKFWKCREALVFAQARHGPVLPHDVSVKISNIPDLITTGREAIHRQIQDVEINCFGHVGDGNLHFNVIHNGPNPSFKSDYSLAIQKALYGVVADLGGSISAEHGIGRKRCDMMHYSRSPQELDALQRIKRAFDPRNVMNPGVLGFAVH